MAASSDNAMLPLFNNRSQFIFPEICCIEMISLDFNDQFSFFKWIIEMSLIINRKPHH